MNIAAQRELIDKLRALAEHPDTPLEEAHTARLRLEEIETKIRAAKKKLRDAERQAEKRKIRPKSALKRRVGKKKNVEKFPLEWPFGWTRRDKIEVESIFFPTEKKIVLGWKCPGCKLHVERLITPKHRARLMSKSDGVQEFIEKVKNGEVNQLCDACWNGHK